MKERKHLTISSPTRRGMWRPISSPKDLGIKNWMWGLLVGLPPLWRKVRLPPQGYESEDVKILETPKERRPIPESTVEEPATGEALAETTATIVQQKLHRRTC